MTSPLSKLGVQTANNWIVVDLDGTLMDSKHREHHAQAGEWEQFHSLLGDDKPNMDVLQCIEALDKADFDLLFLTGRPASYRRATLDWFTKNDITLGNNLLMRAEGDWRSDVVIKPDLLATFFGSLDKAREEVLMVLEDRDKMVEAWRTLGLRCWQVAPGGY